jgi:hypothetical protein
MEHTKFNLNFRKRINTRRQLFLIFMFIAFYGVALGIWENYKSDWLEQHGFSISNLSLIISSGLLVAAALSMAIALVFKTLSTKKIIAVCSSIKLLSMIALACFFEKNISNTLVFVVFMIDTICGQLVVFSIYPLMAASVQNNKLYGKRKLLDWFMNDVGLVIAMCIFTIMPKGSFRYNLLLIISIVFVAVSVVLAYMFEEPPVEKSKVNLKRIFCDKITTLFVWGYTFVGTISYNIVLGMQAIMLQTLAGLSIAQVSIFLLVASLAGDVVGYISLLKFTARHGKSAIILKFCVRCFGYLLVVVTGNWVVLLIATFLSLLVSRSFSHVTDGPYLNRVGRSEQFIMTNYKLSAEYAGKAIGIVLAAELFKSGMRAVFGLSAGLMLIQIAVAFWINHLRQKERVCRRNVYFADKIERS